MGPGTVSADSYQALSWPGQKYGVLKISCIQSICTPFFPASSINGICFCTIASLISSMVPSPSDLGRDICINPDLIILGISYFFVLNHGGRETQSVTEFLCVSLCLCVSVVHIYILSETLLRLINLPYPLL